MTEEKKDEAVASEAVKESSSAKATEDKDKKEEKVEEKTDSKPADEQKEENVDSKPIDAKEEKTEAPTETEGEEVEVPKKFKAIVDSIESMAVLDLHDLVKLLEKKFGVSAAAVAVAGGAGNTGDDEAEEEKSAFDVELTSVGDQKIAVIKAVKATLGLGLKEAKELVDSAPAVLKKEMKKEEAEALQKEIEEAGGVVELK